MFSANFTVLGRPSSEWQKVVFGDSLLILALPLISLCPANTIYKEMFE